MMSNYDEGCESSHSALSVTVTTALYQVSADKGQVDTPLPYNLSESIATHRCVGCEDFVSMCLHPAEDNEFFALTSEEIRWINVSESQLILLQAWNASRSGEVFFQF